MERAKARDVSCPARAGVCNPRFGSAARLGREKAVAGECARAIGATRGAHLEEGGRDGRASVGLVREGLPGARDHRVRVVIPVEPRLVPARTIDRAMIWVGNGASVSANARIGRRPLARGSRRARPDRACDRGRARARGEERGGNERRAGPGSLTGAGCSWVESSRALRSRRSFRQPWSRWQPWKRCRTCRSAWSPWGRARRRRNRTPYPRQSWRTWRTRAPSWKTWRLRACRACRRSPAPPWRPRGRPRCCPGRRCRCRRSGRRRPRRARRGASAAADRPRCPDT